jgi:rhodanese-related sulfurtransferase
MSLAVIGQATAQGSILRATLEETNQKTAEVSTEDVRRILADGSAILLDSRKRSEYVAGHIAGAKNVAPPVGASPSAYTAAVERLVGGDKSKALVLYCNGQHCQASRQLGDQLVAAGFSDVRRYQLGIPMWRALNGPIEIELEGIARIFGVDRTAVFFDARSSEEFASTPAAEWRSGRRPLPCSTTSIPASFCLVAIQRRRGRLPTRLPRRRIRMCPISPELSTSWRQH